MEAGDGRQGGHRDVPRSPRRQHLREHSQGPLRRGPEQGDGGVPAGGHEAGAAALAADYEGMFKGTLSFQFFPEMFGPDWARQQYGSTVKDEIALRQEGAQEAGQDSVAASLAEARHPERDKERRRDGHERLQVLAGGGARPRREERLGQRHAGADGGAAQGGPRDVRGGAARHEHEDGAPVPRRVGRVEVPARAPEDGAPPEPASAEDTGHRLGQAGPEGAGGPA